MLGSSRLNVAVHNDDDEDCSDSECKIPKVEKQTGCGKRVKRKQQKTMSGEWMS